MTYALVPAAVIVDVDGTLMDVSSVRHHVTGPGKRDFDAFHSASAECPPIAQTLAWSRRCRILPVITAFKAAHQLHDVTVVADAGMISEANQVALQAAGLSYILGTRIPLLPGVVGEWRDRHPGEAIPDGLVLTQPWPATSGEKARGIPDRIIYPDLTRRFSEVRLVASGQDASLRVTW